MNISVSQHGDVAVIQWQDGENRINRDSLQRLNDILDELEGRDGPLAVVLTGEGKFFCNGLDLARFGNDEPEFLYTLGELKRFIGRLLVFPAYTVAALNGHTFAGGALISCGFDARIMREDRGYWCMNEAAIGLVLDNQLWSILENRLPRATAVKASITAYRYNGADALRYGIADALASEDDLLPAAIAEAQQYAGYNREIMRSHKKRAHGQEAEYLGFGQ
jgi:Delta3-Delta2-enoyl-CoA isomerase